MSASHPETTPVEEKDKQNGFHVTGKFTILLNNESVEEQSREPFEPSTPFQDHFSAFIKNKSGSKFKTWLEIWADVCSHVLYPHVPTLKRIAAEKEYQKIFKNAHASHASHASSSQDDGPLENGIEKKVPVSSEGDQDEESVLAFVFKQFALLDLYSIKDPKWFGGARVVLLGLMNKANKALQ
jgi:hypothetical protein